MKRSRHRSSYSISRMRCAFPSNTLVIALAILLALLALDPLVRLVKSAGYQELQGSEKRESMAVIGRVEPGIGRSKAVYIALRGKEWRFRWPVSQLNGEPRPGMTVKAEYYVGRSGAVYILNVTPVKETGPTLIRAR